MHSAAIWLGDVFVPAAIAGNEQAVFWCAGHDGRLGPDESQTRLRPGVIDDA
jgi:hypothetical protein